MGETPKRVTRSKSDDSGVSALLMKMKNEIIQATQSEIRKESVKILEKLSTLEGRIEKIEYSLSHLTSKQNDQEAKIAALANQIDEMRSSVPKQMYDEMYERLRRSKNVIISGASEHVDGNVQERRQKDHEFVEMLLRKLNVSLNEMDKITRIGKIKSNPNRLIRVTFSGVEAAAHVLQSAKSLRSQNEYKKIFINPDRTPFQQRQFAELRRELKSRKELGEDVVIFRGEIINKDDFERKTHQNFR